MTPTPSPAFLRGPVSTLQEMLRTISHVDRAIPFLRPTGIFDEDTLAAVMTFQKVHGRPVMPALFHRGCLPSPVPDTR